MKDQKKKKKSESQGHSVYIPSSVKSPLYQKVSLSNGYDFQCTECNDSTKSIFYLVSRRFTFYRLMFCIVCRSLARVTGCGKKRDLAS